MKTKIFFLILMIAASIKASSQIPNNGFEDWNTVGNCMKPIGWFCTNDMQDSSGSYFGITRSGDHFPASIGSYSIRIQNDPALLPGWGALGFAWTGDFNGNDNPAFAIQGHPSYFCGYYKFLPQNNDTMRIFISLYSNGTDVSQAKLEDTVTASEWTPFVLPFSEYTTADSARIFLSSFNSNGAMTVQGSSALYIDNLSFDFLIGAIDEPLSDNRMYIFPNPASDVVYIKCPFEAFEETELGIYNIYGDIVKSATIKQGQFKMSLQDLNNGIYVITARSGNTQQFQKLLIH